MMLTCLIIEDEPLARSVLRDFIEKVSDKLTLLGECKNGYEGLKTIQEKKPDLIFLDVQMPKLTGFEMLELLSDPPKVIFTTAYDAYAVNAFEKNAVDYLLKPFTYDRFVSAIEKLQEENGGGMVGKIDSLQVAGNKEYLERVAVKTESTVHIVYCEDIYAIEAQDDYVKIRSASGDYLKQQTMKYFENALDPSTFVRVHRSHIANVHFMSKIELYDKDSYLLKLKNNYTMPVSKAGYAKLREVLNL